MSRGRWSSMGALTAVVENAAVGMALVGPDGAFLTVNPALCEMLGRDEQTLTAATWQALTHPDDLGVDAALVDDVLAGRRESYRLRKRYVLPGGGIVWGDLSVSCVRDDDGQVEFFISQIANVTEQVLAQRLLADSEAHFRLLAENATDVVVLLGTDRTVRWVAPTVTRTLGWRPDELVGQVLADYLHPEDMSSAGEIWAALISGAPEDGVSVPQFLRLRARDGTYRWLSGSLSGARNRGGELEVVLGLRDVDDLIIAREELLASEQRFRLLAEHGSDVVALARKDGTLEWVSESVTRLLGWAPGDIIDTRVRDLLHPDDVPVQARMQGSLLAGEPAQGEARVRTKDGGYRWINSLTHPQLDDHGNVVGRIAGWRDAQAEHEARQALEDSQAEYRLVAENAADVVIRFDSQNRVQWVSPSLHRLTGWLPEDIRGGIRDDLIHPDDKAAVLHAVANLRAGALSAITEVRLRNRRGSYTFWSASARRATDDVAASDLVVTLRNIDSEVAAKEQARIQAARRVAILDSMLDPHVLLEAVRDPAGEIIDFVYADANQAACDYNQLPREQLVGTRLLDLLPGHAGTGLLDRYRHTVDTGEPLILDDYIYPHEILAEPRRFDIRAVRVGDAISFTWRDITERSEDLQRIAESEERFRLLAEHSSDVVLLAREGIMQWLSPSLTRMLGWTPEQWQGHRFEEYTHRDDVAIAQSSGAEINDGATRITRLRMRDSDGIYRWVEIHASPMRLDEGATDGIVASFRTIEDVVAYEEELKRRATLDDLTGALKRDEALRQLANMVHYRRQPGAESAVVFFDLDHFKQVNDTLGHAAGDAVLRTIARRIRGSLRTADILARMGGDEFLAVLDGVHDLDEAVLLAERIREAAAQPIPAGGTTLTVTLSVGVTLRQPDEDPDAIIARADMAMYEAKATGRNRVKSRS